MTQVILNFTEFIKKGFKQVPTFCLQVSGDYACFSRPEMKVERVSYDVITPSSARAIFEAVFWHPPIQWVIEKIEVLKPIEWMNIRRNEVSEIISVGSVKSAMKNSQGSLGLYIEESRQQRASLILKNVSYRLHARMHIQEKLLGVDEKPGKFYGMFERRAKGGQVFHTPYLGCREFAADVIWSEVSNPENSPSIDETRDLGWMLYDLDYSNPKDPTPMFFHARMEKGVIRVPSPDSQEVRR